MHLDVKLRKKTFPSVFLKVFPVNMFWKPKICKVPDVAMKWHHTQLCKFGRKKKHGQFILNKPTYFLSKLYNVVWNWKDIWLRIILKSWSRLLLDDVALSYSKSYMNNIKGVLGINIYKKKLPYWDISLLYSYFIEIVL